MSLFSSKSKFSGPKSIALHGVAFLHQPEENSGLVVTRNSRSGIVVTDIKVRALVDDGRLLLLGSIRRSVVDLCYDELETGPSLFGAGKIRSSRIMHPIWSVEFLCTWN